MSFVPAKDSKLTAMLAPLICCNARLFILATVSSSPDDYLNSVQALRVASKARAIKVRVPAQHGTTGP
jgi:hypothetical protein